MGKWVLEGDRVRRWKEESVWSDGVLRLLFLLQFHDFFFCPSSSPTPPPTLLSFSGPSRPQMVIQHKKNSEKMRSISYEIVSCGEVQYSIFAIGLSVEIAPIIPRHAMGILRSAAASLD